MKSADFKVHIPINLPDSIILTSGLSTTLPQRKLQVVGLIRCVPFDVAFIKALMGHLCCLLQWCLMVTSKVDSLLLDGVSTAFHGNMAVLTICLLAPSHVVSMSAPKCIYCQIYD